MGSPSEEDYTAFEERVKRTVYIDNISPQVTESVIRTALDQFASVKNVKFIPNYMESVNIPPCALVELGSFKQAKCIVKLAETHPFMMSGVPRPVRIRHAEAGMFDDRPVKPGRKIVCCWLDSSDPDFEIAQQMKFLAKKHADEAVFLLKEQLKEEEKLAKQQQEILRGHYQKYKMIDSIMNDGTAKRLARSYNLRLLEDQ